MSLRNGVDLAVARWEVSSRGTLPVGGLAVLIAATVVARQARSASGCTITWIGDVNADWFGGTSPSNTNWDDDTFPDTSDHVCVNSGTVHLSTSTTVNHYSIAAPATLVIDDSDILTALADSTNAGTSPDRQLVGAAHGGRHGRDRCDAHQRRDDHRRRGGPGSRYLGGDISIRACSR